MKKDDFTLVKIKILKYKKCSHKYIIYEIFINLFAYLKTLDELPTHGKNGAKTNLVKVCVKVIQGIFAILKYKIFHGIQEL